MKKLCILVVLCLLGLTVGSANEQKQKKFTVKRIEVASDAGMQVNTKERWAEFTQSVDIKLDDFRLRCDHLHFTYTEGEEGTNIETLVAKGNVRCDDNLRKIEARSDRLDYEKIKGWLVFSSEDQTEVKKDGSHMKAKTIRVKLESGEVLVDGAGRMVIDLSTLK
jgi:lipopolysaccharide transport protein LptA